MFKYLAVTTMLIATPAFAQMDHNGSHDHTMAMDHEAMSAASTAPTEPGQSAFAAIQEIVELLMEDPQTDWSKVDIPALREHLADMNNVTLYADVKPEDTGDGMRFKVAGAPGIRESIQRMVTAHAATMNGVYGFSYESETTPEGAVLIVHTKDMADRQKLRGLGFIGIMTLGAHHQEHHLAIARGASPHDHQ